MKMQVEQENHRKVEFSSGIPRIPGNAELQLGLGFAEQAELELSVPGLRGQI
jgi:hypothetical protein